MVRFSLLLLPKGKVPGGATLSGWQRIGNYGTLIG